MDRNDAHVPGGRRATVALLAAGVALLLLAGNDMPPLRWAVVAGAVGLALLPGVSRPLASILDKLRRPSKHAAEWGALVVFACATAYLVATAFAQNRGLTPKTHDDCSYVIGARMLAHGRLWMPQHPLADFFESFYLIVKPVYCSIYFPGTALAFAPMEWLDWPAWMLPVLFGGACAAALYLVVTELFDGAWGVLAVVWLASLTWFRTVSFLVMSHVVMLLLGLMLVWAWLRWRRDRRWGWAVAIGAFAGWAAITRPVDALAYAVPIGLAMAAGLRGKPVRAWATTAGSVLAGAAPFLALQLVFNAGVTGSPLRTPYTAYLERDQPGAQFGLRRHDPSARPASSLPQKQAYYDWCRPYFEQHQPGNFCRSWFRPQEMLGGRVQPPHLLTLADTTLPGRLLLVLVPAGLAVLGRWRWAAAGAAPLFVLFYAFNPFFLPHYPTVIVPAVMVCVFAGAEALSNALSSPRVRAALAAAILALSVTSLWQVKKHMALPGQRTHDGFGEGSVLAFVNDAIQVTVRAPAVVLFRPPPQFFAEAVYNADVAWPDDAAIIRAHDLGERNREIIEYYAERQPARVFHLVDWTSGSIVTLGDGQTLRQRIRGGESVPSIMNPK